MTTTADEIPPDIVVGIEECLGDRVQHGSMFLVRVEGKAQRLDPKIMVLSAHRAFLMLQKVNTKIDADFNYLELLKIESMKPLQIQFHTASPSNKTIKITTVKPEETNSILEFILTSLRKTFPQAPIEKLIPNITIQPADRSRSIHLLLDRMTLPELGPCGGFTQMYACMCDLHGETYQAEVAWDVDTIYLSQDTKELCLNDFDHLEGKDLVPIVASLMYNLWFTKLTATNVKLNSETTTEIKKVLSKSSALERIKLDNVGIKSEFAKDINTALTANPNTALRHIDLSNNLLEDRGIKHLAGELTKVPNGLVQLRLAKTGLTSECTVQLGKALLENNFMPTSLVKLDLSGNPFKDGDINNLTQFIATPNAITHLNLADTEIALDNIFNALYRGCTSNLSHLNLAGNTFAHRKNAVVPQAFKQYFATTRVLQYLNLSGNKLPGEVVKEVILGIGSNSNLKNVELDLSSNELRIAGGRVVESCIANVPNITKLNLSNNDLNTSIASLLDWISQNNVITSLDLSQNLTNLRHGARAMIKVIDAIVQLIQNEETALTTLSVANNKLKFETTQIINALGSNTTLSSVDLSGNSMGDIGARMLAKALMINTKLCTVAMDSNGITAKGFADIANALERNYTLKYMPTPVNDVSSALKNCPEKTQEALQKIQMLLQRNHSSHKFSDDQAFRLQQGFMYTTSHQLVDQLVVQIQDMSKDLADVSDEKVQTDINTVKDIIKDADNSKQLLTILHKVALESDDTEMMNKLEEIVTHAQGTASNRLEENVNGMLAGATNHCSHMMKDKDLRVEIETACEQKKELPERFMQDITEQVSSAISSRISAANLAVASIISDTIIDEIIEQLTEYQEKLSVHVKKYGKSRVHGSFCNIPSKPEAAAVNGEKAEDEEESSTSKKKNKFEKKHRKLRVDEASGAAGGKKVRRTATMRMLQDKRKSVKVRPRSSVVKGGADFNEARVFDEMPITEEEDQPQNNSHSRSEFEDQAMSIPPSDSNDATDGSLFSSPAKPIETPLSPGKKKKEKLPQLDVKVFNELSAASQTRLQDVRKNRPRRPGGQRPTRVGITTQAEKNPGEEVEEKVDAGIDAFYKSEAMVPGLSVMTESPQSLDVSKDDKGSRFGLLFKKKLKTPKPEKPKVEKIKPPKEDKPKLPKKDKKGGIGFKFGRSKKSISPNDNKPHEDSIKKQPIQDPAKRAVQEVIEDQGPEIIPDIKGKQESTSEEDPTMSSSGDELEKDLPRGDKDSLKSQELKEEEQVDNKKVPSKPAELEEPPRKQSYKPPGAQGMPGMGGGNMFAEMKKKQDQKRASSKSQELKEEPEKEKDDIKVVKKTVDEKEPIKKVVKENEKKKEEIKDETNDKEEKISAEDPMSTEIVETPDSKSQGKKPVPQKLSLHMSSGAGSPSTPTKPPSPRVSPTKPTPSPKNSPRSSGAFAANKRASSDIANAFRDKLKNEAEEKAKEEEKKEGEKKEVQENKEEKQIKNEDGNEEEVKPQVQIRKKKPQTPTPSENRNSITDPQKRKSNPFPVMEKRKSGTPVGASKLVLPSPNTHEKPDVEDKSPEVSSNGGVKPSPRPLSIVGKSNIDSGSATPKIKPVPKPRPSSGAVPPPSIKPKPSGRKPRELPTGFSPQTTLSMKSPASTPHSVTSKPRSVSVDQPACLKGQNIAFVNAGTISEKNENEAALNGDAEKSSDNSKTVISESGSLTML